MTRKDGRSNDQLRPVKITTGYQDYPEGSALIEVGNHACVMCSEHGGPCAAVLKGSGDGLGNCRVFDVAGVYTYPHTAQS